MRRGTREPLRSDHDRGGGQQPRTEAAERNNTDLRLGRQRLGRDNEPSSHQVEVLGGKKAPAEGALGGRERVHHRGTELDGFERFEERPLAALTSTETCG